MKLKAYKTEIKNLYLVISHRLDGEINSSYILVNDENNKCVEIIPKYGPLTVIEQENILESYLKCNIEDRGHWTQCGYDDNDCNILLNIGNLESLAAIMSGWL